MSTQNTRLEYLYRDAGNNKVHNEAILTGQFSTQQQETILSCLDVGEYFIPHLVGLPEKRFDDYDEDLDHPWFELDKYSFESTNAPPSTNITPEQLVSAFQQCKDHWSELKNPILIPTPQKERMEDPVRTIAETDEITRIQPGIEAQIRILADREQLTSDQELFCSVYARDITKQYVQSIHAWEQAHGMDIPFHVELERMHLAIGQMAANAKSPSYPQENLSSTRLYQDALAYFSQQAGGNIDSDFTRAHAAELILCYEHQMDLLDFDYWTQYEGLIGQRLSREEYFFLDRMYSGDPLDVTTTDRDTIAGWQADLESYRDRQVSTLADRIIQAESTASHPSPAITPGREPAIG